MTVLCVHCLTNASNAPQNYFPGTPLGPAWKTCLSGACTGRSQQNEPGCATGKLRAKQALGKGLSHATVPRIGAQTDNCFGLGKGRGLTQQHQQQRVRTSTLGWRSARESTVPGQALTVVAISRSPEQDEGSPWPRHGPMFSPAVANNVFLTLAAECNGR